MQGASRDAALAAEKRFLEVLRSDRDSGARLALADSLYELTSLLDREDGLRRTLADPSLPGERKTGLVDAVFGRQLGVGVLDLLREMAQQRWSSPRDLVDTLERLGASAALAAAELDGVIDEVEDQLFRFTRIVASDSALRRGLGEAAIPVEHRTALLADLLGGRVHPITASLVERAVVAPRGRTLESALGAYGRLAADRRERVVATVRVAATMTEEQTQRMARVLARLYGREVALQITVDPDVVGGVQVHVGDEVIDGTIASRFERAGRGFRGR